MTSLDEVTTTAGSASPVKKAAAAVVWVGTALAGITAILSACGYMIESSYLATLGVPRSAFDANPTEYVLTGGNFFAALPASVLLGLIALIVYCWWCVVAVIVVIVAVRWFQFSRATAIAVSGSVYGVWIALVLADLTAQRLAVGPWHLFPENRIVLFEIFTAGLACAITTLLLLERQPDSDKPRPSVVVRLPFLGFVVISVLLLPYLRGTFAIVRVHPVVRPLGAAATYLRSLRVCSEWRLIEMGPTRTLLSCSTPSGTIAIPTEKLKEFELQKGGP